MYYTELQALIDRAMLEETANRYPGADGVINGHTVEARIVMQCRRTTSRRVQNPSVMWKVDGKRVSISDILVEISK